MIRYGELKITSVQNKNLSNEEVLKLAILKRDEIINQMENDKAVERTVKNKDHNNEELPKGISKVVIDGTPGYVARIIRNKKNIRKFFVNNSTTMDKQLQLAKEALINIDKNFDEMIKVQDEKRCVPKPKDHNDEELPEGISKIVLNGMSGYGASVLRNKKRVKKSFLSSDMTMDKKLQLAKEALVNIEKNFDELLRIQNTKRSAPRPKDHNGNDLPIGVRKQGGKYEGYRTCCKINGIKVGKSVTDVTKTMDERLEDVLQWINDNKNK